MGLSGVSKASGLACSTTQSDLLFLDEPTTGLDIKPEIYLGFALSIAERRGMTVVLTALS